MCLLLAALMLVVSCLRTQEPTKPVLPPPLAYLGEWGAQGNEPGQLLEPVGLAADTVGNVYVADRGSRYITKFDAAGHPLLSFQIAWRPIGITVDLGGAMYIITEDPPALLIYFPEGEFYRQFRSAAGARFQKPAGVAVDGDGNFFVADAGTNRIDKFNPRGRWVKSWGLKGQKEGQFSDLGGIVIGPDGYLYVVDSDNHRIEKFTHDGDFAGVWGNQNGASLMVDAAARLAFSAKDVFLVDPTGRFIQVWTLDGQLRFSDTLAGPPSANLPAANLSIAVSSRNDLFVLDSAARRVLRYRINP